MGFTLVEKKDRPAVLKTLTGRRPITIPAPTASNDAVFYPVKIPKRYLNRSSFMKEISKVFPDVKWRGLTLSTLGKVSPVAILEDYFAWRNGWDSGKSNFLIYHRPLMTWYRRANVDETVELLKILKGGMKDLPLYVNSKNKINREFVCWLLKGESK